MKSEASFDVMVRYCLGHLSDEERQQIEQQYLTDDTAFEELMAAEEEVADRYVRDELADAEREHVEALLARSASLRDKVALAKELLRASTAPATGSADMMQHDPVKPRRLMWGVWQAAAGAAVVLLSVAAAWLWGDRQRLSVELDRLISAQSELSARHDRLQDRVRQLEGRPAGPTSADARTAETASPEGGQTKRLAAITFVLDQPVLRGAGAAARLNLPSGASAVEIRALIPSASPGPFRITLRTVEGQEIATLHQVSASRTSAGLSVAVTLAADLFEERDYFLLVTSHAPTRVGDRVAEYAFGVTRRQSERK